MYHIFYVFFFPVCIGVLSSCAMGGSMPVFSVLFGDVTAILGYEDTQKVNETSSSVLRSRTGTLPGGNPYPITNPLVSYTRCLRIPWIFAFLMEERKYARTHSPALVFFIKRRSRICFQTILQNWPHFDLGPWRICFLRHHVRAARDRFHAGSIPSGIHVRNIRFWGFQIVIP